MFACLFDLVAVVDVTQHLDADSYDQHLKQRGMMDLQNMSRLAVSVLGRQSQLNKEYQLRYRHILVDEFQDSSPSQIEVH